MTPIVLPKSGLTSEEATLTRWCVAEGERVEAGQLLCEAETEKATVEVTAPAAGLLRKVLISEGETRPVGVTLGWIGEEDEPIPEAEAVAAATAETVQTTTASAPAAPRRAGAGRVRASPAARKLAAERGVDLAALSGSGPGGAITTADVERAVKISGTPENVELVPMSSMRRAIARTTQESFQQAPHFYLTAEANAEPLLARRPEGISITHCLVKAAGLALREFPQMCARLQGEAFAIPRTVNIGLITAVDDGLLVPVIRDADQRSLAEIADTTRSLVEKARSGRLSAEEVSDAGFTITNLGMYGVETFQAIIHPPEAAILAVGAILEKPAVVGDKIVPAKRMALTLSCDHRIVDGVIAAQFLGRLKALAEEPSALGMT
jgi:pyruvate dehydrogenase E2 component (dihydrolipoamide acetyltransferase)